MAKALVSQANLEAKQATFTQPPPNIYAYTVEGDPNFSVITGDGSVLTVDTTATPATAQDLIARIRTTTDKSIKHVVLSHYHTVCVPSASAYFAEGAQNIIVSRGTYEMIVERGEVDIKSEIEHFLHLSAGVETVLGLTWPTLVFERELILFLGKLEVKILHLGLGRTKGDMVVRIPSRKVLFSGDLVEYDAACYCGDVQLEEWLATPDVLRALGTDKPVPGRGPALLNPGEVDKSLAYTRDSVSALLQRGKEAVAQKMDLKAATAHTHAAMDPKFSGVFIYEHCLPFDATRALDEVSGIKHPCIWVTERDKEMWTALQG